VSAPLLPVSPAAVGISTNETTRAYLIRGMCAVTEHVAYGWPVGMTPDEVKRIAETHRQRARDMTEAAKVVAEQNAKRFREISEAAEEMERRDTAVAPLPPVSGLTAAELKKAITDIIRRLETLEGLVRELLDRLGGS